MTTTTQDETQTVKDGVKTSEFWSKIAVQVVLTLVMLGYLPKEQGDQLTGLLVWLISVAMPEIAYIYGRSAIKVAALKQGE